MSAPTPLEDALLRPATDLLDGVLSDLGDQHGARLDVLEGCASRLGGFCLASFRDLDELPRAVPTADALGAADKVLPAIRESGVHPSLALTALARPRVAASERRTTGAYYTDWRLAQHLAAGMVREHRPRDRVIDPACGTGILLVAFALQLSERDAVTRFIADEVHAADLAPAALRGVKLSLASLTSSFEAIAAMATRLRPTDSLLEGRAVWQDLAPDGFDTVIGNPPWEKLKVTRHEHLAALGIDRDYGSDYGDADLSRLGEKRAQLMAYAERVGEAYVLHGGGELDLYKLFLALALDLAAADGQVGLLIPAGLIRSDGTAPLRREVLERAGRLRIAISDNKARHFAIDTRFKFLVLHALLHSNGHLPQPIVLEHIAADRERVQLRGSAQLERGELQRLRRDLTVPEVRSDREWQLFRTMSGRGVQLGDPASPWGLKIVRELDMTNDRGFFHGSGEREFPLIEGRMVHQFRHAAKSYVSGRGRSAAWQIEDVGSRELTPQFSVDPSDLPDGLRSRVALDRIGFCDITGQTNERSMLAARVPPGAVCNNKVPTITIEGEDGIGPRGWLWLAIANSFAFDWLLRRLVTTTVNYFILRSVPFPSLSAEAPGARRLASLAQQVECAYHGELEATEEQLARWRAEMDVLALQAYGLGPEDAQLLLTDFPLLDRGQPPLEGEARSTITRDLVLATFADQLGTDPGIAGRRVEAGRELGAAAYVPSQLARQRVRSFA